MIITLKPGTTSEEINQLQSQLQSEIDIKFAISKGDITTTINLIGDTSKLELGHIQAIEIVAEVKRIQKPYKQVSREYKTSDTIIDIAGIKVGGNNLLMMAGPCSVESETQILEIANSVKQSGANMLRGGIVKPRTSPYVFQGMGLEGLKLMQKAKQKTGLPIVCEIMSIKQLEEFGPYLDLIQIGTRNMQNFDLLKALGKTTTPILLKRGMAATIEEFLMSAEYIVANGNPNVILCERGIRTFETAYRNVMDLNAIPMLKHLTHLPIVVDTAHGTGIWWMVEDLTNAAVAVGAHGIMVEVHNHPEQAFSDGQQSLKYDTFKRLMENATKVANVFNKQF